MSKKQIIVFASVKGGMLHIPRREDFLNSIRGTFDQDCRVEVKITKVYNHHSDNQRGYYFGGVIPYLQQGISEQQGVVISKAEAHEILKLYCNYIELLNEKTGEIIKIAGSTRHLTTVQYEEFLDRCRKWIYDYFGIEVPLPNEQIQLEFKNTTQL